MSSPPVLSFNRSPLTQAVLEARVNDVMEMTDIQKIVKILKITYPNKIDINNLGFLCQPQPMRVTVSQEQSGVELASDDQLNKVIISKQSITIARLAPYLGWEVLHENFKQAWNAWKKVAGTRGVSRLGIRFINRIDIPFGNEQKINLEDYLTFYPKVPEFGDRPMTEYEISVTQPIFDSNWSATIRSMAVPSPLVNHLSLLFDVDVFRTEQLPLNDVDLFRIIDEARPLKNTVFEKCLTDQTKELFS